MNQDLIKQTEILSRAINKYEQGAIYSLVNADINTLDWDASNKKPKPSLVDLQQLIALEETRFNTEEITKAVENHIYSSYPQAKQNSDLADKMYFETILKGSGNYPTLEALIAKAIADFYTAQAAGKPVTIASLATPLAKVAGDEIGIEQLIKVGIRVKWVQDCKAAYAAAVANIQASNPNNLTLPVYPL